MPGVVGRLLSMDFEVFGLVQGVFFRKCTREIAKKNQLVGWVRNSDHSTVVGTVQGPEDKIEEMKVWLTTTGSPASVIERCEFRNEHELATIEYKDFIIRH